MIEAFMRSLVVWVGLLLWLPLPTLAEPYLAVEQGYKCNACHVNPTGGGLRNQAGAAFAQYALPAYRLPDGLLGWNGRIGDFIRLGGDLRTGSSRTEVPNQTSQRVSGLEQMRLYGDVEIISDRLDLYLDELLAPGNKTREEAYLRLSTSGKAWTLKAGQFYLPFGWRLQDNTAFVREVSGISMTNPDKGIELGMERDEWSAQLAYTNGPGNVGRVSGHQVTAQVVWLQPWGRVGGAYAATTSTAGNRQVSGLFGGFRSGPLAWLGEIDLVRDAGYPEGRRTLLAALGEVNWRIDQGFNLKLTGEYFDPDRKVAHDNKVRQSLLLEFTPIAFIQLRAGYRRYLGIPQNNLDNRKLGFVELHGLF